MLNLTESLEDYLEAIWILTLKDDVVRIKNLAAQLGVTTASVAGAVKVLKEKKLVDHEKYGHVQLTPAGAELARKVYERHVAFKRFFTEILRIPDDQAEKDACRTEHHISKQTFQRFLGFLHLLEQHREELPWLKDLDKVQIADSHILQKARQVTLKDLEPGMRGAVRRINGSGTVKRRLMDMGVVPGAEIKVIKTAPLGDPLEVEIKGYHLSIRKEEAEVVLMKEISQ